MADLRAEIAAAESQIADRMGDAAEEAGDDQADAGAKTFEREHELALTYNARDLLAQNERALGRIEPAAPTGLRVLRSADRQGAPAGVSTCDPMRDMQTARGTSLSDAMPRPGSGPAAPSGPGRAAIGVLLAVAATALAADVDHQGHRRRDAAGPAARPAARRPADAAGARATAAPPSTSAPASPIVFTVIAVGVVVAILRYRPQAAQPALGDHPRPAARRRPGQPGRPPAAVARVLPRPRGRLDRAAALAGVQPGRLGDRLRRRPGRPAGLAGSPGGRHGAARRRAGAAARRRGRRRSRSQNRTRRLPGPSDDATVRPRTAATATSGRQALMAEHRSLPVPDGLEGERLDAALARLFGLSRSRAAEVIAAGDVLVDGQAGGQVRPDAGGRLARRHPARRRRPRRWPPASRCPACRSCTRTTTSSWSTSRSASPRTRPRAGPARPCSEGLLGAGHTIATSGAAERQGIVHRLDANTTGADGRGQERGRLLRAQAGVQGPRPSTSATTRWSRAIPTRCAARSTRRSTGTRPATAGSRSSRAAGPSVTHYDTIEAFRAASLLDIKLETGRTHQIRVHMSARAPPVRGRPRSTAPTRRWRRGSG